MNRWKILPAALCHANPMKKDIYPKRRDHRGGLEKHCKSRGLCDLETSAGSCFPTLAAQGWGTSMLKVIRRVDHPAVTLKRKSRSFTSLTPRTLAFVGPQDATFRMTLHWEMKLQCRMTDGDCCFHPPRQKQLQVPLLPSLRSGSVGMTGLFVREGSAAPPHRVFTAG